MIGVVFLSVLVTTLSPAETEEPIEMTFVEADCYVAQETMY